PPPLSLTLSLHDALPILMIVGVCAVSRMALRRFASGDMSSASGSYIESIETAVRSTSIGSAFLGIALIASVTACGIARLELSFRSEEHTSELQSRVDLVC